MIVISEYQNKSRNAKVYKTEDGNYNILMYDADFDYNGYHMFSKLENAENYAEAWVLQH